jgi:hypothetical protein
MDKGLRNKKIKRMRAFLGAAIIVGGLCLLQYVRANGHRLTVSVPHGGWVVVSNGYCVPPFTTGEYVHFDCFTLSDRPSVSYCKWFSTTTQTVKIRGGDTYLAF